MTTFISQLIASGDDEFDDTPEPTKVRDAPDDPQRVVRRRALAELSQAAQETGTYDF